MQTIPALPPQMTCSLAGGPADFDEVFRLRYGCYRRSGAIAERPDQRFSDSYDSLPNQFSLLLRSAAGEPVATVRLSVVCSDLAWSQSPAVKVFGDHPAFPALKQGAFVEASRLCFGLQARRDMFYGLLGHMAALAEIFRVEWLVACPRVEHAAVYQRLYGFHPVAPPRQYFGVNFQTELLAIRVEEIRRHAMRVSWMGRAWSEAATNLRSQMAFGR